MKIFMARQPILNRKEQVVAYELLFRSGAGTAYDATDDDAATISVISGAFLLLGMNAVTGRKRAFINFTRNLLKQNIVAQLPPQTVAIEILENIEPDEEMIAICTHLKQQGYTIVLDDFIFSDKFEKLTDLADIIKVDFLVTKGAARQQVMAAVNKPHIKFLAEKVETRADFEEAVALGYSFFQGYFFSKPELLAEEDMPSYRMQYARMLNEIHQPDIDYGRLETIVKYDVAFSYKLLKYINSAHFGLRRKVDSVRQALTLLGKRHIVQWISLLILRELRRETPVEVAVLSVMRAKFGELLVQKMGLRDLAGDVFIMGMFSLLDCFLKRSLEDILADLPIRTEIKQALLGADNLLGDIHEVILAYEKGQWQSFRYYAAKCNILETEVPEIYLQALEWTGEFFELTR